MTDVAIVGVSGFSGMELVRLLDALPSFRLTRVFADSWAGQRVGAHVFGLSRFGELLVESADQATSFDGDIVFLATPAEASLTLAADFVGRGRRVIDLSGAFRLRDRADFRTAYGFEAPSDTLLAEAVYGLPQVKAAWGVTGSMRDARLVANPGCYATAAILPLSALLDATLIEPDPIFCDGKSGVTGAGRKIAEKYLFTEVAENCSPYRVGNHQHTPEIEQALSRVAGARARVTFTPHLLPVKRGLIVTSVGRVKPSTTQAHVDAALARAFDAARDVVEITRCEEVTIASVANTPKARLGVHVDETRGTFVAICAIDNLLKGAASQAVENLVAMTS